MRLIREQEGITVIKSQQPYDRDPATTKFWEIRVYGPSRERFKQLIARALNTFCDAHPELKELGDILEHGKPLQDYYSQRSDKLLNAPTREIRSSPDGTFSQHPFGTENPE